MEFIYDKYLENCGNLAAGRKYGQNMDAPALHVNQSDFYTYPFILQIQLPFSFFKDPHITSFQN